jgi:hypothetical protein
MHGKTLEGASSVPAPIPVNPKEPNECPIVPPVVTLVCHTLKAGGAEKQLLLIAKALLELGARCEIRTLADPVPAASLQPFIEELNQKHNLSPIKFSVPEALRDRRPGHTWWTWGRRADLALKLW